MTGISKLTETFQQKWKEKPIYNTAILDEIDNSVQLHTEIRNVRSSAAACINTIGNIAKKKEDLIAFLNKFNVRVDDIIPFPTGASFADEKYNDSGNVIFEWMGPKRSPLNEIGGKRGQNRTSVDAYILANINGKVTQLLIEWKFTETYNGVTQLQKFAGIAGCERLRRYSLCLAKLRKLPDFPFKMNYEGGIGLYDLGYEPYYQLMRMTLLAKLTTPFTFDNGLEIEDYRIVHLSHSKNDRLNTLSRRHISHTSGLRQHAGESLHEVWRNSILSESEVTKFHYGYWNEAVGAISNRKLREYLIERYG